MSALFSSSTQNLRATLSVPPAYDSDFVLLTAWVKWDSEATPAQSTAFELRAGNTPASDDSRLALVFTSGPNAAWYGGWTGATSGSLGAAASDSWRLIAAVIEPNTGSGHARGYNNASSPSSSVSTYSGSKTTDLSLITIGNRAFSPNSGTVWMGRVAECAIWIPDDATEATAIVYECLTKRPDAVTTAAPVWYASLESDAAVTIGSSLTNNGTVTFSDADHPSLSGGTPSATITLTDPVAVVTGSTASCTITRDTVASGTVTYNLSSSNTGVATVPATATIADGQLTGSFNVTGVSAGSSTITATNAGDSGETDTATANVSALKGIEVTFGQTNLTGLTFAWFDEASPDLFDAPTVVGTTESTDGSGVLSIDLTGTSVAVGNTGFLLIYKAGATAPDDLAFFGRLTVQDIG